jgi:fermentation-respiration switch protein FrsA (DUF1100 family)
MKPSSRPLSLVALSLALSGSLGLFTQLSQAQTRQAHTVNPLFAAQQSSTFKPGLNRVTFQSGGETLVGNLYLPNNYQAGGKLPAVIISGSWTTVKEQMAADYGQRLSAQGFAAFAYDSRSFGESGGKLRSYKKIEIFLSLSSHEKAAIPQRTRQYFAAIPTQNKQFVWLNNRTQFDFYDQAQTVSTSVDLVTQHLRSAL